MPLCTLNEQNKWIKEEKKKRKNNERPTKKTDKWIIKQINKQAKTLKRNKHINEKQTKT